ncbi:hypothetical protein TNCV_1610331 [Trichonephila clavipes]|nr:hypothetical protein TNCV_1610331 [Trichonephila clavipes]
MWMKSTADVRACSFAYGNSSPSDRMKKLHQKCMCDTALSRLWSAMRDMWEGHTLDSWFRGIRRCENTVLTISLYSRSIVALSRPLPCVLTLISPIVDVFLPILLSPHRFNPNVERFFDSPSSLFQSN